MDTDLNKKLSEIGDKLECWWEHEEMENPCLVIPVVSKDAKIPESDDMDKWWNDVDFVVEREMATIDATEYYGEAVPYHYVSYGASAMACALGAEPEYVNKETIWAHPVYERIEDVMDITFDRENSFYKKMVECLKASVSEARGHHIVASYAFGACCDNLAGLYGTENLLADLIMKPDEVKQVLQRLKEIWVESFNEYCSIVSESGNEGGVGWAGVWAPGSTFPIQEDFAYMISPEMFREFVLPHTVDMVEAMDYPMFHLDGVGMIPHLDALLEIEKLKVIQWVPGAGKERLDQWYDLIRRIKDSGKSVQVFAEPEEVDDLVKNVGGKGLLVTCWTADDKQAQRLIERYGD